MKQRESEVEAAIGRADVRGGDSPREGASSNRDSGEQKENEGSSMEESRPSSEGSGSLPGMQGIFLKQSARELEMVTAVKGGVQRSQAKQDPYHTATSADQVIQRLSRTSQRR